VRGAGQPARAGFLGEVPGGLSLASSD